MSTAAVANPYVELKRRVQEAGLLLPRPRYYTVLIAANLSVFAGVFAFMGIVHQPWAWVLGAVGLGFLSGQLGFQMHDAGHRQMFASRRLNRSIAFLTANVLLGISSGWWIDKHNRHHGNPNHVDLDPDIKIGMISYSTSQALEKRGLSRMVAARQAYLFFPLVLGLAWAMHAASVRYLLGARSRAAVFEAGVLVLHLLVYVALLTLLVGPWWAIVVIVIHKCVTGFYTACVFAPNHKGMPQVRAGERLDFLRSQVLTARNVRSHRVTDFLYGGLNYQIEHHLFPSMPRCNVRAAHKIVRQFCGEVGVAYHETSIVQSYREILGYLNEVGAPLRRTRPNPAL